MTILRGVAAGLGEGMMAAGRLVGEEALTEQRANLELEKQKALDQFKLDQKNQERARIGGIVATARDQAIEQAHAGDDPLGPNPPDRAYAKAGDNAAIQALVNTGDLEAASQLDKMRDSGNKVVPWGSTYVDQDGKPLYDNGADLKGSIQQQQADARKAAIAAKGQPKPITQEQIDRITTQTDKIVTNHLGGAKNPFAMPGEDPKTSGDAAKQNLMSSMLSKAAVRAAQDGKTLDPNEGFNQLKAVVDKYDQTVTTDARTRAAQFFDEKGRLKEGALAQLQKANVPDAAAADKQSFMRWYRDSQLSNAEEFNAFVDAQRDKGKPAPAAQAKPAPEQTPAPAAKPAPAPAAAPEKKPIVQQARNADAYGSNFAERQKTLIERERKADSDPELQRLMASKNKALRDNKAVDANNYLAQYNQIRKERYGL